MDGGWVSCSGLQRCTTKTSKISCTSTLFQVLPFCGPHEKPHGVRRLSKNYHSQLNPKLFYGKCAIRKIPCACISCTNILDKPWNMGSNPTMQIRYQPVENCTYCPALVYFNNWNIIKFNNKTTINEYFDAVYKAVLYGISYNISALVQKGKYGAINTADPTTMGYYLVKFLPEPYTFTRRQNSWQESHKVRWTYSKSLIS